MLNYRVPSMVAGAVALWLSGSALADGVSGPVAVFPPHNATGEAELDWVAVGLQDSLTVSLWYASALHTEALPNVSVLFRELCPELALPCVTGQDLAAWRPLAQAQGYGGFLWGEYQREGETWVLRLGWYDPHTEQPQVERTVRRDSLAEVPAAAAEALLAILADREIAVSAAERDRMRAPQTTVLAAWEQNARGFWEQQRYHQADAARQPAIQVDWERYLRAAVRIDPDYAEAWNNLGWQQFIVRQAADADPSSSGPPADPFEDGATSAGAVGEFRVEAIFQQALRNRPELVDALVGQGKALQHAGQLSEALVWYERAVALNPSLPYHRKLLLDAYLEAERPEDGLAQLATLDAHLKQHGREDERQALNDWRGRYYEALHHWSPALAAYEALDAYWAGSDDASCSSCRLTLADRLHSTGETLAEREQPQDAEAYFRRALFIREAVQGPEPTTTTLRVLEALADVVEHQARADEARALRERFQTGLTEALAAKKRQLGGDDLQGVARDWWQAFEEANSELQMTLLVLFEEMERRQSSLEQFFEAYLYSDAENVPEVLRYLDQRPAPTSTPPADAI